MNVYSKNIQIHPIVSINLEENSFINDVEDLDGIKVNDVE